MKILIVNDDGYKAQGLKILIEEVQKVAEVIVFSPAKCESAQSHKITIHSGIKVEPINNLDVEGYLVHGSAADCVRVATFLNPDIDLVLSGINHGLNVGYDIYYSSTIAAITEAGLRGYRGVALSCDKNFDDVKNNQLESIVKEVVLNNSKYEPLINVNFPNSKYKEYKGLKHTIGGNWHYENKFELIDGVYHECTSMIQDNTEGVDSFECLNGYVSITNLTLNRTYK